MTHRVDLTGEGTVPTTGPLVISLGRPNAGREWDLRRLTIVGTVAPQTAHAAVIFVVGGSSQTSLNPADIEDTDLTGIPDTLTYSRGTIVLQSVEVLQVWAFGLTAGLEVTATAQVETEPDR